MSGCRTGPPRPDHPVVAAGLLGRIRECSRALKLVLHDEDVSNRFNAINEFPLHKHLICHKILIDSWIVEQLDLGVHVVVVEIFAVLKHYE